MTNTEEENFFKILLEENKPNFNSEAEEEAFVHIVILNEGFDLNMEIEKQGICLDGVPAFNKRDEARALYGNFTYYKIDNGRLIIFTEVSGQIHNFIKELVKEKKPEMIVCPVRTFHKEEETKTKLDRYLKRAGVEFKIVSTL